MLLKCILNNSILPIDLINNLIITQDVESPIITGSFSFMDTTYTKFKDIVDNEEYQIQFKVYDIITDDIKYLNFNVTNINGGNVQEKNEILIEFESYYSINLTIDEITGYFKEDIISNIAIDILHKNDIDINYISKTSNKLEITFPYITGFDILKYLKPRMVDKNLKGGYLFFPDLFTQKMNIVNYFSLWSGEIQNYEYPLFFPAQNSDEYIGNCTNLEKIKTYNLKETIDKLNIKYESFSLKDGKIYSSNIKIKNIINTDSNTYNDLLINENILNNITNKKVLFNRDETELINLNNNKSYEGLNSLYDISVICRGDWNRKLGGLVSLTTLKEDESGLITDNKTTGMYIIKKIDHFPSLDGYSQNLILGKSGVIIEDD
jgi:hypothetical protein